MVKLENYQIVVEEVDGVRITRLRLISLQPAGSIDTPEEHELVIFFVGHAVAKQQVELCDRLSMWHCFGAVNIASGVAVDLPF